MRDDSGHQSGYQLFFHNDIHFLRLFRTVESAAAWLKFGAIGCKGRNGDLALFPHEY